MHQVAHSHPQPYSNALPASLSTCLLVVPRSFTTCLHDLLRCHKLNVGLQAFPSDQPEYRQASVAGPAVLLGYYRPSLITKEGVALEVAADILSEGRTSRLVSELVLQQRILSASVLPGYPGDRHAGMTLVYGVPKPGGA